MPDTTAVQPPIVDRPLIPAEYGIKRAKAFVDWSHVERRLTESRVYWVATAGPRCQPHVRPVTVSMSMPSSMSVAASRRAGSAT